MQRYIGKTVDIISDSNVKNMTQAMTQTATEATMQP